ncbi:MAG TPA: DUF1059 domain-containing protein [Usitatibacter sp.]|nr:DUF1059 domain-containing protein [Usitatibacter sp.]
MVAKFVQCDCGFTVRSGNDDALVAELQKHASEHHKMNLSREQVLAMARPDPAPSQGERKT